ncbi:MAG: hypothetical protein JKY30_07745 [Flavobacteriales bacterium]|nr:hypothetical protein [Flavobacteriales bacterium]
MKLIRYIEKNKSIIFDITFIVFVFIISFPHFEPDFNTGLDAPFRWGYNYLWINDYETLTQLIYSYGPLGFLKVPVALENNFTIFLLFYSLIKLLFLHFLLKLGKVKVKKMSYPIILIVAYFLNVDLLLIGIVFMSSIFYLRYRKVYFYIFAILFSLIGLYIKSSIGISCFSTLTIFWILLLCKRSTKKEVISLVGITILTIAIVDLIIAGNIFYFFHYIKNVSKLSLGYSSAMALFPKNNWFALSVFLLSIFMVPWLSKKNSFTPFMLLIIPFYSMWKHAMIRESIGYFSHLLDFTVIFWVFICFASPPFKKKLFYLIPIVSVLALYINAKTISPKYSFNKDVSGLTNLTSLLFSFEENVNTFRKQSNEKVSVNKIHENLRNQIGESTIDIYPWDFSFIPANSFNWKPRKTFQSIGLSGWLDKKAAQSFERENGPEFILFHAKKDTFGGSLGSIDFRHLLNIEPLTNNELFKNYNIFHANKKFTLFKKNNHNNFKPEEIISETTANWKEWVDVPQTTNGILKTKVTLPSTLLKKIILFAYKDYEYYIDYQTSDGNILTYRFIPSIAKNGIWINPMVTSFQKEIKPLTIIKIKFRSNSTLELKEQINLQWVFYEKQSLTKKTLFNYEE